MVELLVQQLRQDKASLCSKLVKANDPIEMYRTQGEYVNIEKLLKLLDPTGSE